MQGRASVTRINRPVGAKTESDGPENESQAENWVRSFRMLLILQSLCAYVSCCRMVCFHTNLRTDASFISPTYSTEFWAYLAQLWGLS